MQETGKFRVAKLRRSSTTGAKNTAEIPDVQLTRKSLVSQNQVRRDRINL